MNPMHLSNATHKTAELDTVQLVGFLAMFIVVAAWSLARMERSHAASAQARTVTRLALVAALSTLAAVTIASPHWPEAIVLGILAIREASPLFARMAQHASLRIEFLRRLGIGRHAWRLDPSRMERLFGTTTPTPRYHHGHRPGRDDSDDGDASCAGVN